MVALVSAADGGLENPVYRELIEKGIAMSDGSVVKLQPPILADGLDAAAQHAAIAEATGARASVEELVGKSYYAPVIIKVRTARRSDDEDPAKRMIDVWFVVRGKWDTLTSEDFLESVLADKGNAKSRVVSKSGILTEQEMAARKLTATVEDDRQERFVYATFSLFERVEVSATRFSVLTRGEGSILTAGKLDDRFVDDPDYPNQWRPLVRDEQAEIKAGPAHPFAGAGGYAKITRLAEPTDAALVECHLIYEEPYGWFEGANLVKQKVPAMVQQKVRTFRRKLALADAEESGEKKTD